jgi:hypothetical protein
VAMMDLIEALVLIQNNGNSGWLVPAGFDEGCGRVLFQLSNFIKHASML